MKLGVSCLVLLMVTAVPAIAGNDRVTSTQSGAINSHVALLSVGNRPASRRGYLAAGHSHWHFVGCAESHDHCHHIAEHAGYHHATVRHDHDQCHHHPHLACYAWN